MSGALREGGRSRDLERSQAGLGRPTHARRGSCARGAHACSSSLVFRPHRTAQLTFDAVMVRFFGFGPMMYLVLCLLLAGSLHPTAGAQRAPPGGAPADGRLSSCALAPAAAPGPARRPLPVRALRLPPGPGDVLVLRLAEPHHLQRGLPQRAPRFPLRRVVQAAAAARSGTGVLLRVRLVHLVVGRDLGIRHAQRHEHVVAHEARPSQELVDGPGLHDWQLTNRLHRASVSLDQQLRTEP